MDVVDLLLGGWLAAAIEAGHLHMSYGRARILCGQDVADGSAAAAGLGDLRRALLQRAERMGCDE